MNAVGTTKEPELAWDGTCVKDFDVLKYKPLKRKWSGDQLRHLPYPILRALEDLPEDWEVVRKVEPC